MTIGRARLKMKANRVDAHVGRRLRLRRIVMGMSINELAKTAGLAFQQIHKYERGINRIAASDLYRFGQSLGVPVSYFFAGLPAGQVVETRDRLLQRREALDFIRAYHRIASRKWRRIVYDLIRALAGISQVDV